MQDGSMALTMRSYTNPKTYCFARSLLRVSRVHGSSSSLSLSAGRQRKSLYSSRPQGEIGFKKIRDPLYPLLLRNENSAISRSILTTVILAGTLITLVYRKAYNSEPLQLEAPRLSDVQHGQADIEEPYLTPVVPITADQATGILRWEESSHIVGQASGVQRFDNVRVPSNSPVEDEIVSASGTEGGDVKWLIWGVFDGRKTNF